MRNLATLLIHFIVTIARLMGPGGVRSVVAESLLVKHQLLILNRSRTRAPALRPADRVFVGMCSFFVRPTRLIRSAILLKPSTLLSFHKALVYRKYRLLFTPTYRRKPGPKGPSEELVSLIVDMKRRNPRFGYQRIADQLSQSFNIDVDKDVVRRVLAKHYKPESGSDGPSWLTFLGHSKDSLWSVDLFRCESLILRSHWVMVPLSHPFIERLIGTLRREFLDHVPFWGRVDLERKLNLYKHYYNTNRTHRALNGIPPAQIIAKQNSNVVRLYNYRWKNHCRGMYQLPVAA